MRFAMPGSNKRVCAYLVDVLVGSMITWLFSWALSLQGSVTAAPGLIYMLLRDCYRGRSIGKALVGLQVFNEDDEPIEPLQGILRNFLLLIPIILPVEYVVMRSSKKGLRLGDQIALTHVADLHPEWKGWVFLLASFALVVMGISWGGYSQLFH